MTNKIVAIQGDHPSKLKPLTDTSIFLAVEAQRLKYKIFYYEPKDLSIINDKVIANGYYVEFSYSDKRFFKILHNQKLELTKCKYILIRQDPPFNLEYISTTYILDKIKNKVKIINNPTSIRNISEKLYSTFFQKYILQGRILNGKRGFILATIDAFYAFMKEAKLWEKHLTKP